MKASLIIALSTLTLAAATALASSMTAAMDDTGMEYTALQTESSWMAVEVPLSALGGTVPGDLSIAVSGLPEGTTVTLAGVDTDAQTALLDVDVARSDTSTNVNAVADIAVLSGGVMLTTVSIPVYGAAYSN